MSELLDFDEEVLLIQPTLALHLGLNESIILQQVDYWLDKSRHIFEGKAWIYNTYENWQVQFPFMSISTIRRTIKNLEEGGILVSKIFNKRAGDKTKWYCIDYDAVHALKEVILCVQNEQTHCSNWTEDVFNLNKALPENTTENIHIYKMQTALKRIQEQKEKKGRAKDGKTAEGRRCRDKNSANHHKDPGEAAGGGVGYRPIPPDLGQEELDCSGFY